MLDLSLQFRHRSRLAILAVSIMLVISLLLGWSQQLQGRTFGIGEPSGSAFTLLDSTSKLSPISIDYPEDGSIFPPGITPPSFLWRDAAATSWSIDVSFAGQAPPIHILLSKGEHLQIGPIDQRCIVPGNMPTLTPEQAATWTWKPSTAIWSAIQSHSVGRAATVTITGHRNGNVAVSQSRVTISTSTDPVGAPIFYRDVPLMPTTNTSGAVQPLAPSAIHLIQWRLRDIRRPESHTVLANISTCANCHSFSAGGKTMGMDVDGPANDKGLYAIVPVEQHMQIWRKDLVHWNTDGRVGQSRVGFMSQVSPNGRYVISTFAGPSFQLGDSYYDANFMDYRFLQVFYPTRGILEWYSRAAKGVRRPLPGADDPRYVQTDGVWSPDGRWIVFARAHARNPRQPGHPAATYANDPNETQIKYDLYRVPFNGGKGGTPERIVGASENGMSNNFPKVSPDGKWIVFVECKNGQLMRPDSELYIVPFEGGVARRLRSNMSPMNSWHSFSPNGRWLVFSSKARSPYTQMYLTHIDKDGNSSPPILIDNAAAANRAVNIPEFVNTPIDGILDITLMDMESVPFTIPGFPMLYTATETRQ